MIGFLEYEDSDFLKDLMNKINKPYQWIKYKQLPAPFFNDYKVIIDRLSLQNEFLNTALKIQSLNNVYIINNPFSCDALNKGINISIINQLGIPHPKTFILPCFDEEWDMSDAIGCVDWEVISNEFSFPVILKPLMGWGWQDVYEIQSIKELKNKYELLKEKRVMVVQEKIAADKFFRVFCIGKENAKAMLYEPAPLGAGKILLSEYDTSEIEEWSLEFCKKVDLDFNVVEWAVRGEDAFVIDSYNPIPDVSKQIPYEYYEWIIEKMANFVNRIYDSKLKNKPFF